MKQGSWLPILILGVLLSFIILIFCVIHNIALGYALALCWVIFMAIGKREYGLKTLLRFSWEGAKTSFGVLKTLILIGALIGIWMASGTIATIVYDAFKITNPQTFILIAFVVCAGVSFIIGTSFGTISIVGLPLMLIAKSGDINLNIVAGAIMAGVYFGDRCSPLSSSASLVATITATRLFRNIRNMFASSWLALLLTLAGYWGLSLLNPLNHINTSFMTQLKHNFTINWLMLIPVIIVLVLSVLRQPISRSIPLSILAAAILGVTEQHQQISTLLATLVVGYHPATAHALVQGGGVVSMISPLTVVPISCAIAGILNHLASFTNLQQSLANRQTKLPFGMTVLISFITSAIGCNQSIAIIMTNTLMRPTYGKHNGQLAVDLENSSILTAPLIPWNIAAFVPTAVIGASFVGYIPFALYLYLVPLVYGLQQLIFKKGVNYH